MVVPIMVTRVTCSVEEIKNPEQHAKECLANQIKSIKHCIIWQHWLVVCVELGMNTCICKLTVITVVVIIIIILDRFLCKANGYHDTLSCQVISSLGDAHVLYRAWISLNATEKHQFNSSHINIFLSRPKGHSQNTYKTPQDILTPWYTKFISTCLETFHFNWIWNVFKTPCMSWNVLGMLQICLQDTLYILKTSRGVLKTLTYVFKISDHVLRQS